MSSNIIPGNIDGTFPVAGQDNSSQGFRDNFTAIRNNFTAARTEILDLQDNKANTDSNTSFNDNTITRAVLKDCAETVFPQGSVADTIILNHESGHYQTAITSDAVVFGTMQPQHVIWRLVSHISKHSIISSGSARSILHGHHFMDGHV